MPSGVVRCDRIGAWRRRPITVLSARLPPASLRARSCMPSQPVPSETHAVIVGVDTHEQVHAAVAINRLGARLGTLNARADRAGYAEMVAWPRTLGPVEAFGIEGTGSYG